MKGVIAVLAVCTLALLTTLALYQFVRWLVAVRAGGGVLALRRDPELMRLADEKRRLFNHLREIRFDYETGKLDVADYKAMRDRAEREASAVLDAIDAQTAGAGTASTASARATTTGSHEEDHGGAA